MVNHEAIAKPVNPPNLNTNLPSEFSSTHSRSPSAGVFDCSVGSNSSHLVFRFGVCVWCVCVVVEDRGKFEYYGFCYSFTFMHD